jgi:hypothetical protein
VPELFAFELFDGAVLPRPVSEPLSLLGRRTTSERPSLEGCVFVVPSPPLGATITRVVAAVAAARPPPLARRIRSSVLVIAASAAVLRRRMGGVITVSGTGAGKPDDFGMKMA